MISGWNVATRAVFNLSFPERTRMISAQGHHLPTMPMLTEHSEMPDSPFLA
jgi:hypothetical protein